MQYSKSILGLDGEPYREALVGIATGSLHTADRLGCGLFFFPSSLSGPQSKLCDASPNEDFTLSLGADQSIRVTCSPILVTRGNTRGLLKNNLDTYVHILDIRNTKENPIMLELQEQVPLSTSEKIKVGVAC